MVLAPICLFTYNRPEETKKTIEALSANYLAPESDLYVFSDGPKTERNKNQIDEVRKYLKSVNGFKSVHIYESRENQGLANSVISGVSKVVNKYEKVIVLEDDLITSPNFLDFMNQALTYYESENKIFSVSGYSLDLTFLENYSKDYYFGFRASSWGWGTWKNRWNQVDWSSSGYRKVLFNPLKHFMFMRGGSDMPLMLWKQMNDKIDSWAIRWCFDQFKKDLLTVFPSKSKLYSIGFGESATHTKETKRFNTVIDGTNNRKFNFSKKIDLDMKILSEFRSKFSFKNRLMEKIQQWL